MIAAAVKLFEWDAIRHRWRGVSFSPVSRLAWPKAYFGDDLAPMRNGDDAAGLLRRPQLEFDPGADVADRGLQPRLHMRHLPRKSETAIRQG